MYAYILSLVPDRGRAEDILQETNITLWHKSSEFDPETYFLAWACRVAYFKILSECRRQKRDKLVFHDQLLDYLAERQTQRIESFDRRRQALQDCLQRLSDYQRELIQKRYLPGGSVQQMAQARGQTVGVVSQTLYRIRAKLNSCIRTKLTVDL